MGGWKERPVYLGMENDFFEAEGEGSFAGGNKRAALGGRRPPALRVARLRHRVAQLTKVWPPGVPLMQKNRGILRENAQMSIVNAKKIENLFL